MSLGLGALGFLVSRRHGEVYRDDHDESVGGISIFASERHGFWRVVWDFVAGQLEAETGLEAHGRQRVEKGVVARIECLLETVEVAVGVGREKSPGVAAIALAAGLGDEEDTVKARDHLGIVLSW